ncbi:carbonic anhydrase 9 [Denticeps clupeoides]|uniref:carbonic anhydrase 9 n=1 Tax=Denticeps clupeoides TaxID=299321 RepID=UPI0010A58647|nr:carbonic anhydrase 9-like [Denticeps clupeoides]
MQQETLLTFLLFLHILTARVYSSSSSSEEDEGSSEDKHKESHHGHHWGYTDQKAWASAFQHCNGKSQSPINIDTRTAVHMPRLPSIMLDGYDLTDQPTLTLKNNGHTLVLKLPGSMRIVHGFDEVFIADHLHFHWGTIEEPGSEHTIDTIHFPAEIHVVHYNSKYHNLSEAATMPDGLAVLGAFIGIGLHENDNYEKILSVLTDVSIEESNTQIPGFNVRHLLPNSLDRFYRYNGSLTTPPCFQTVNWTIFNDTIRVSRKQLASLEETLKVDKNHRLNKNFRAPQLLYGRQVQASFSSRPLVKSPRIIPLTESEDSKRDGLTKGDVLAIVFGILFGITVLAFVAYAYQHRKKSSKLSKDPHQNVIYKLATKEEA